MDFTEKIKPTVYTKYSFKIEPPIFYEEEDETVSHDTVLAHTEEDARNIMDRSYGKKFKVDYILLSTEEVTLFDPNYIKQEDDLVTSLLGNHYEHE
jgi:hypothetical protein